MPHNVLGDSSIYLQGTLQDILPRALNEVCQTRPSDPIEFLARYLYKAADCDLYFHEKAVFETKKRMLGVQLKRESLHRQNSMARYKKHISELQEFIHTFDRKGTSVKKLQVKQAGRRRRRDLSLGTGREEDIRQRKISFFDGGGFGQSFDYSSPTDASLEDESSSLMSPKTSVEASGTPQQARRSMLRKSPTETQGVVSVHKDSRTLEDDVLERSPSTLTSSSRTTSRRTSVAYADEGEITDSLAQSLQLQEPEVKVKRKSRIKHTPKKTAETDDAVDRQQTSRKSSVVSKRRDSSIASDISISALGLASIMQIAGDLERFGSLKEQTAKRKRKRKTIQDEAKEEHTTAGVSSASESDRSQIELAEDEQKAARVSRGEIAEETALGDIQEEPLGRQSSAYIAVDVKKEQKARKTASKQATFDRKRSRKSDHRVDGSEPSKAKQFEPGRADSLVQSGETSLVPSRETSLVPSDETSSEEEDETDTAMHDSEYERYITGDADSLNGTPTDRDDTEQVGRRYLQTKQKKLLKAKKRSTAATTTTTDVEDALTKRKPKSAYAVDSDQKGKGKRRIAKREMKFVDDDEEAAQLQVIISDTTAVPEMFASEPEDEQQQFMGVKRKIKKKPDKKKPPPPKETPEDYEEADEGEQEEDSTGSRKFSKPVSPSDSMADNERKDGKRMSITPDSAAESEVKKRRRRRRPRKSVGKIFDDDDQEEPRQSTETSYDDFVRKRQSLAKLATRKAKPSTISIRRRSASKTRRTSRSEVDRMPSGQYSEILLSEYPDDAENLLDTSLRPSEIEQIAAETTEEPYSFPCTPVVCEWLLIDSHTLVCRHPVLGDIRSRPITVSHALDFTGWTDRSNYNWRAIYDHEMYTVMDPFLDDQKFRRRMKGP